DPSEFAGFALQKRTGSVLVYKRQLPPLTSLSMPDRHIKSEVAAMLYQRALETERLDDLLRLIRTGRYSTPSLAQKLEVSVPTIPGGITALRHPGGIIRWVKLSGQ